MQNTSYAEGIILKLGTGALTTRLAKANNARIAIVVLIFKVGCCCEYNSMIIKRRRLLKYGKFTTVSFYLGINLNFFVNLHGKT